MHTFISFFWECCYIFYILTEDESHSALCYDLVWHKFFFNLKLKVHKKRTCAFPAFIPCCLYMTSLPHTLKNWKTSKGIFLSSQSQLTASWLAGSAADAEQHQMCVLSVSSIHIYYIRGSAGSRPSVWKRTWSWEIKIICSSLCRHVSIQTGVWKWIRWSPEKAVYFR